MKLRRLRGAMVAIGDDGVRALTQGLEYDSLKSSVVRLEWNVGFAAELQRG